MTKQGVAGSLATFVSQTIARWNFECEMFKFYTLVFRNTQERQINTKKPASPFSLFNSSNLQRFQFNDIHDVSLFALLFCFFVIKRIHYSNA